MARALTILIILQSVVLVGLVYQTFALQQRLDSLLLNSATDADHEEMLRLPDEATAEPGITVQQLRNIVREEMTRFREESSRHNSPDAREDVAESLEERPENSELASTVSETLEAHIAAGSMSDGDMARLQADIVKLNPEERTRLLRRLVRAINSGQLKARL